MRNSTLTEPDWFPLAVARHLHPDPKVRRAGIWLTEAELRADRAEGKAALARARAKVAAARLDLARASYDARRRT